MFSEQKKFLIVVMIHLLHVLFLQNKKRYTGSLTYNQLLFCTRNWKRLREQARKPFCVRWKKERNEYTHCQFHLVLCAVNRTINHYVYPEGFTALTCRSRTVGSLGTCISHLSVARCVDLSKWKWNEGRFDVAIYFHTESTRNLQREHFIQTFAQLMAGSFLLI